MWTREKTRVDGGLRTHGALAFCAALLLCCGRLSGAVVTNGFVIVDAPGVRVTGTGDAGFHVSRVGVAKDAQVRVTARPGWRFASGKREIVFPLATLTTSGPAPSRHKVRSDLGEDETEITWEDCTFAAAVRDVHVLKPDFKVHASDDVLRLYMAPDKDVFVSASASVEILSPGLHRRTTTYSPCPVCKTVPKPNKTEEQYEKTLRWEWHATGPGKPTVSERFWSGRVAAANELQKVLFRAKASCDSCEQCTNEKMGETQLLVRRLGFSLYHRLFGLDRTDDGRCGEPSSNEYQAFLAGTAPVEYEYEWTECGICMFAGSRAAPYVTVQAQDLDRASARLDAERLSVSATIRRGDRSVSATCTTNFTVVKLDVQLPNVSEGEEETVGLEIPYFPDGGGGSLSAEARAALVPLTITCEPDDVTGRIEIEAPEKLVYEKRGSSYIAASRSYRVCDLKDKSFFVHGHAISTARGDQAITVRHPPSGAVDRVCVTVCEYTFTVNVDMPGDGSDNRPYILESNDPGHAYWKFSCSPVEVLDQDTRDFVNKTAGVYANPPFCVRFVKDEDGNTIVIAESVKGVYKSPDPNSNAEVTKSWHLTKTKFQEGVAKARELCILSSVGNLPYHAVDNNCVHAVVQVAAAAGIQLPVTHYGWYACTSASYPHSGTIKMLLGPTAYNLGTDLINMK